MEYLLLLFACFASTGIASGCSCERDDSIYTQITADNCHTYTQHDNMTADVMTSRCPGVLVFDVDTCACNWPTGVTCSNSQCDDHDHDAITGAELLPYGEEYGDMLHPPADDECLISFDMTSRMPAYTNITSLYVCTNGIVSLNAPFTQFELENFPLDSEHDDQDAGSGEGDAASDDGAEHPSIIAPFWADIDLTRRGKLWVREGTWSEMFNGTDYGNEAIDEWAILVTWQDVIAYGSDKGAGPTDDIAANTFQCLIYGNNDFSSINFWYSELQWPTASQPSSAQMGYDIHYGRHYYMAEESGTSDISAALMRGQHSAGSWMFRLPYTTSDPTDPTPAWTTAAAATTAADTTAPGPDDRTSVPAPQTGPTTGRITTEHLTTSVATTAGSSQQGANLWPYGPEYGDIQHPAEDDRCGISFDLTSNVPAYTNISSVYICTNGIVSINTPYSSFQPVPFPLDEAGSADEHPSIIAPFWTDIDLTFQGKLWARKGALADVLNGTNIEDQEGEEWAILITWEGVEAFGSERNFGAVPPVNTFQCVIRGNSRYAAIDFLYADLQWPSEAQPSSVQMGYDINYGGHYFTLNESSTVAIRDVLLSGQVRPATWTFKLPYNNDGSDSEGTTTQTAHQTTTLPESSELTDAINQVTVTEPDPSTPVIEETTIITDIELMTTEAQHKTTNLQISQNQTTVRSEVTTSIDSTTSDGLGEPSVGTTSEDSTAPQAEQTESSTIMPDGNTSSQNSTSSATTDSIGAATNPHSTLSDIIVTTAGNLPTNGAPSLPTTEAVNPTHSPTMESTSTPQSESRPTTNSATSTVDYPVTSGTDPSTVDQGNIITDRVSVESSFNTTVGNAVTSVQPSAPPQINATLTSAQPTAHPQLNTTVGNTSTSAQPSDPPQINTTSTSAQPTVLPQLNTTVGNAGTSAHPSAPPQINTTLTSAQPTALPQSNTTVGNAGTSVQPSAPSQINSTVGNVEQSTQPSAVPQLNTTLGNAVTSAQPSVLPQLNTTLGNAGTSAQPSAVPQLNTTVGNAGTSAQSSAPPQINATLTSAQPTALPQSNTTRGNAGTSVQPSAPSQINSTVGNVEPSAQPSVLPQLNTTLGNAVTSAQPSVVPQLNTTLGNAGTSAQPTVLPQLNTTLGNAGTSAQPSAPSQINSTVGNVEPSAQPSVLPQLNTTLGNAVTSAQPSVLPQLNTTLGNAGTSTQPSAVPQLNTTLGNAGTSAQPSAPSQINSTVGNVEQSTQPSSLPQLNTTLGNAVTSAQPSVLPQLNTTLGNAGTSAQPSVLPQLNTTLGNAVTPAQPSAVPQLNTTLGNVETSAQPTALPSTNATSATAQPTARPEGATLYPYGTEYGDILHPAADDSCQISYDLSPYIPAYTNISSVHICTNGIISLNAAYPQYLLKPFPLSQDGTSDEEPPILAPFWSDIDLRSRGHLWVRNGTWKSIHSGSATGYAQNNEWSIVVTWENVMAYGADKGPEDASNTFQCLLYGNSSFAAIEFLYGDLQWPTTSQRSLRAQMGYDINFGNHYFTLNESGADALTHRLMVGQARPGVWTFLLPYDQEDTIAVTTLPPPSDSTSVPLLVRLVDGPNSAAGRVEVRRTVNEEWGTVCDDSWDMSDGHVICRSLGYSGAVGIYGLAEYGEGTGHIYMDNLQCTGYEWGLMDCRQNPWGSHDCSHREDAGVICSTHGKERENNFHPLEVRLADGPTASAGRVEVRLNDAGDWGTVCDDIWDINDAHVVCRMLGYGSAVAAQHFAYYGQGTGGIYLDDLDCAGSEDNLLSCPHRGFRLHNCVHSEDAGVSCNVDGASPLEIRLVDGPNTAAGRVEVRRSGHEPWGTICDDHWDIHDANVVCRMLGYSYAGLALGQAVYGQGTGEIYLDDLHCNGLESSILSCQHNSWGQHNCGHYEDVGVVCDSDDHPFIRLVGGPDAASGRVEIRRNLFESWGTVCDDQWDINDAHVVCRMLGYSAALSAPSYAAFGQGTGDIYLDNVDCYGFESSIMHCAHNGWIVHDCGHHEDASAVCRLDDDTIQVRLADGPTASAGRVEVRRSAGYWGTVCDDGWDINDAHVVCRMLGYSYATDAVSYAEYGEGTGYIYLDDMQCHGTESNLMECQHTGWLVHNCVHAEDAGASCA